MTGTTRPNVARSVGRATTLLALIAALFASELFGPLDELASSATRAASPCERGAVAVSAITRGTRQLIVVKADGLKATTALLSVYARDGACFVEIGGAWPAWVGRSGLSSDRREGDGTTPIGTFAIGPVVYGVAPDPGARFAYHRLVCGDWWDEDPSSAAYNRFVHVSCGRTPLFGGDSEALWTELPVYRYFAVIDFNTDPVVRGLGSGIFLHVSGGGPTNGCVSIAQATLVRILRWLRPADRPLISITA